MPTGVTVSGVQTANITSTGAIGGSATAAVAEVQKITIGADPAAGTDTVVVNYNGLTQQVALGGTTKAAAAAAVAAGINALAGAPIAVASSAVVTITAPTKGTPLPEIALSNWSVVADAAGTTNVITTANQAAGTNAQYDVSGWTGLTNFNGTSVGGENIKAAATTSISATDSALGTGAIATTGGNNVTINALGQTTGTITVGDTAVLASQPTGAVSVTTTAGTNGVTVTAGAIDIDGGTTVSVAQSVATGVTWATANATVVNQSAVEVDGSALTTSVTVNQANYAAGNAAQTATAGSVSVTAVPAAPGVQAVTGVTGVDYVATTKAASAKVTQGAVTINDKNGSSQTAAGTISTVTLNGWANASTITTNALTTLNLSGTTAGGTNGLKIVDNLTAHQTSRTTLALNTTSLAGNSTGTASAGVVADDKATIGTINLTNAGVTNFDLNATKATTLNIAGTGSVTLPVNTDANTLASLTSLSLSGAVSFSDNALASTAKVVGDLGSGLASYGSALTITNTTSGNVTAYINATKQAYTGGAGNDTIVIAADASKAIVGGAGTDELVLGATGSTFTAAYTGRNVSGFETLGLLGVTGGTTVDVAQFFNNTFSTINVRGSTVSTTTTVNNVAQNTAINFANDSAGSVVVNYIDKTGASDNVTVTIGSATNSANKTVNALTVQDANGVGIGTLNIVSNNTLQAYDGHTTDGLNTITTLTDNSLANLNVSGSGALLIGDATNSTTIANTALVTSASTFTINNTGTNSLGLEIVELSGANSSAALATVNFAGSNKTVIDNLLYTADALTLTNTGTSTAQVMALDASLSSLTLNGSVRIGSQSGSTVSAVSLTSTDGITVAGSTDNAQVALTLGAAGSAYANVVTLGNGNNNIVDATYAGDVTITVGSGSNLVKVGGTGATDAVVGDVLVTLGVDDPNVNNDYVYVGAVGDKAATFTSANIVVAGANTGDRIYFAADTGSDAAFTASTQGTTLATVLANLVTAVKASGDNNVAYQNFAGNTYVAQYNSANTNEITIVEITGVHTLTAGSGYVALAS